MRLLDIFWEIMRLIILIINSFYDEQGVYHCRLIDFLLDKVDFLN